MKKRVGLLVTLVLAMVMTLGLCMTVMADAVPPVNPCTTAGVFELVYVTQNDDNGLWGHLYDADGVYRSYEGPDGPAPQQLNPTEFGGPDNALTGHVYHRTLDGYFELCDEDNPYTDVITVIGFTISVPNATAGTTAQDYIKNNSEGSVSAGVHELRIEDPQILDKDFNTFNGKFILGETYYYSVQLSITEEGVTFADNVALSAGFAVKEGTLKGKTLRAYNEITVDSGSDPTPAPVPCNDSSRESKAVIMVAGGDLNPSEAPSKTVMAADTFGAKSFFDMKVHSADERTTVNQKFLAQNLIPGNVQILLTENIYPGRDLSVTEHGSLQTLSWNNLPKNQPGPVHAVVYNQFDGAYIINGVLDANGVATFTGFKLRPASTITICK